MSEVTLKNGRYVLLMNWTDANNGRWTFARDTETNQEVYIKEFKSYRYPKNITQPNLIKQQERADRFKEKTEAIMSNVREVAGPNGDAVVTVDFFRDGLFLYKVTPKVDFLKLSCLEVSKTLTVTDIDILMKRLTYALSALHAVNILHCDLKPDNIFIIKQGTHYVGKVSDFDDSFFIDDVPPSELVVSTPEYLSTELGYYVVSNKDEPDIPLTPASDVFSLGLIYHEYLTGSLPKFDESKYMQLWEALINRSGYALSKTLDVAHHILINRMLQAQPNLRIANCGDLANEIGKIQARYNKAFTLRLMDGGAPLSGKEAHLFAKYPVGPAGNSVTITDYVAQINTDADGVVTLKGLPDVEYFVKVGRVVRPVKWIDKGGNAYECALEMSQAVPYVVRAVYNGAPAARVTVTLMPETGAPLTATTNDRGEARFLNLSSNTQYTALCMNSKQPVTWGSDHVFVVRVTAYTLRVLMDGAPAAGQSVRIILINAHGARKTVGDYKTNAQGCLVFTNIRMQYQCAAVVNGQEYGIRWNAQNRFDICQYSGYRVYLRVVQAVIETPIAGVSLSVYQKDAAGRCVALKQGVTNDKGTLDCGRLKPGSYMFKVEGLPNGFEPKGFKLNTLLSFQVLSADRGLKLVAQRTIVFPPGSQVVLQEAIARGSQFSYIYMLSDGRVFLRGCDGAVKETQVAKLGLFGLEAYKTRFAALANR